MRNEGAVSGSEVERSNSSSSSSVHAFLGILNSSYASSSVYFELNAESASSEGLNESSPRVLNSFS